MCVIFNNATGKTWNFEGDNKYIAERKCSLVCEGIDASLADYMQNAHNG